MSDRLLLLIASLGLFPIALSYGLVPSQTVTFLLGFTVEGTNHTHVFRAIMGLYLANILFWLTGFAIPSLRLPALWGLFIFMGGPGSRACTKLDTRWFSKLCAGLLLGRRNHICDIEPDRH